MCGDNLEADVLSTTKVAPKYGGQHDGTLKLVDWKSIFNILKTVMVGVVVVG